MTTVDSLGARVHALRTRAGLSQAELGAAAGVSGSYVSLIEAGQRVPRKAILDRLSRALRSTRAELLGAAPANPVVIEMELAQAQSSAETGNPRAALRQLESLLRRYADSLSGDMTSQIRLARGAARCQAGDRDQGLAELEDLLAADDLPADLLGRLLGTLAACYLDAGDLARAVDLAERGLRQLGGTELAHFADYIALGSTLASAYSARGDLVSADAVSRRVLGVAQRQAGARVRGEAYRTASLSAESIGDMRRALVLAAQAIGAFGESEAHLQLARMKVSYARILLSADPGRSAEAVRLLGEAGPVLTAAGTAADAVQCRLQLARGHLAAGRGEEAVAVAAGIPASARPASAYGHFIVARVRLAEGRPDEAGPALAAGRKQLLAAPPSLDTARAWRELGDLYLQAGLAADAAGAYDRALTMAGLPAQPWPASPPR